MRRCGGTLYGVSRPTSNDPIVCEEAFWDLLAASSSLLNANGLSVCRARLEASTVTSQSEVRLAGSTSGFRKPGCLSAPHGLTGLDQVQKSCPTGAPIAMYNRINGSYYYQSPPSAEADEQADANSFADAFTNMRLGESGSSGSSSSATRPYSLVSTPPVIEFKDRRSFREAAKAYHGDEIKYIADNPQEYSDFVSARARRTAEVAEDYGTTRDSDDARYFSYQLGNKSVGLLRMEGGDSMTEFDVKRWQQLFPGRTGTTSTVDLQVVHPLVENAGDILLEHQLRMDGERPLLNLRPANPEARARAAKMGFVEVDEDNMVLDPEKSANWIRNSDGEWQRKGTTGRYLSKADDSDGSDSENVESSSRYDYEDDFM
ncbi:hypothetical protein ACVWZM_002087 [Bradyrhizobium sp. USDA 4501]